MSGRSSRLALVALLVAGLIAGCGGENEGTSERPTKAEYVAQANEACRKIRAGLAGRIQEFMERERERKTPSELADRLTYSVLLPAVELELEGIRAIRVPRGEARRMESLLYSEQRVIDRLAGASGVKSIEALEEQFASSGERFREYGLTDCANGPDSDWLELGRSAEG